MSLDIILQKGSLNETWKPGFCVCVCVRSEHTLCMCQALGAKPWIKGSRQQRICLHFVIVSAQTAKCVKLQVKPVRLQSLPKASECWEIQKAGSCFPSLTCGRSGRGRDWTVEKKEGKSIPALMESDGEETFNIHKHTGNKTFLPFIDLYCTSNKEFPSEGL